MSFCGLLIHVGRVSDEVAFAPLFIPRPQGENKAEDRQFPDFVAMQGGNHNALCLPVGHDVVDRRTFSLTFAAEKL